MLDSDDFVYFLPFAVAWALLLYWHADKTGNEHATAWLVAGFIFGIFAAAVYFARYWSRRRRT